MTMVLTDAEVVVVEAGHPQQQGELGGHAADAGHVVVGDETQHVSGAPAVEEVEGRADPEVPRQLGHEADVGELGARQHGSPAVGAVADVGSGHGRQLALAEHGPAGRAGGARGEDDGHQPVGVGLQGRRGQAVVSAAQVGQDLLGAGGGLDLEHRQPGGDAVAELGGGHHQVGGGHLEDRGTLPGVERGLRPAVTAPSLASAA